MEVFSDEDHVLKGIFFQDQIMLTTFQAYPELLCVDATYKLLQIVFPTYIFLCEDSNGLSEAVAVCLLTMEDTDCIKWMVETFKKFNSSWSKVRVVMATRTFKEGMSLSSVFPMHRL